MLKLIGAIGLAMLATACTASSAMQNYVGGPLIDPVLRNGPPTAAYDMGDGTRAFVWDRSRSFTTAGSASSTGTATVQTMGNTAQIYGTQSVTYRPPSTSTYSCNYVLLAQQTRNDVDGPAAWTVTGFRPPELLCE